MKPSVAFGLNPPSVLLHPGIRLDYLTELPETSRLSESLQMLFTALYYPHTSISSQRPAGERLLKRALLLWDELEFIVPYPEFRASYPNGDIEEALEIIGRSHCPSEEEQNAAHSRVEELVTRPSLPASFYYRDVNQDSMNEIYPQKFLTKTWKLLKESRLVGPILSDGDYPLDKQAGLSIMAILADCCAGMTRSRVTDQAAAYAAIDDLFMDQGSIRDQVVDRTLGLIRGRESLVSLRLSMMDIDRITIRQLIDFRKREFAENGHTLRSLRHRYAEHIEKQVKEFTKPGLTNKEVADLEHQFSQDASDDLSALRQELGDAKRDLAAEIIVTVLTSAAKLKVAFLEPVHKLAGVLTQSGEAVHLGGIVSSRNKFLSAHAKILREHPMAFVYELEKASHVR